MSYKTQSRRQFLGNMAALLAAPELVLKHRKESRFSSFPNSEANTALADEAVLENYLNWLEKPYLAALNDVFAEMIGVSAVGLLLYDMTDNQLLAGLKTENLFPIASAFKSAVLMYFVHQIDESVWGSVPVEYWTARQSDEVPEPYRAAWEQHSPILFSLHEMIVISDNKSTGVVLQYVARQKGSTEPLVLFNDWSREVVGISQLSGMSDWAYGISGMNPSDSRFVGREANIDYKLVSYSNMMTPRDLGLYYAWMWSAMSERQREICKTVLSIIKDERRTNLEKLAHNNSSISYSKSGSLGVNESVAGIVITDGGIIHNPDGKSYLLIFMSANADTKVEPIFQVMDDILKGKYDTTIARMQETLDRELNYALLYDQHLTQAYTLNADFRPGQYNYAFVRPEGIRVYSTPSEQYPVRNPVISNTRFGVHLLMQGALVRYQTIDDDEWVQLIPDSPTDNVQFRLGYPMYVKLSDLWPISYEYSQPIPYLADSSTTHSEKYVIISLISRELIAFEKDTLLIKTPIVLNPFATPRGSYVITTKWFARSMQPWAPGVPFTAFFDNEGFAIHGSPWQRWEQTVNKTNITKRTSAGCINIPNWMVTIGNHTRPLDELLFRWLGGMEQPESKVYEYPSETYPAVRVIVVDYPEDLKQYFLPPGMASAKIGWPDVIAKIEAAALTAPDSYFAEA
ncbi:MAG: L,D-transpeptidase family protein [Anaerolineae bacterium]|nr:L,D-transpeptidase family protein [Anaerolineae bacterium]